MTRGVRYYGCKELEVCMTMGVRYYGCKGLEV